MQKTLLSTTALLVAASIATPSIAQWTISAGVQSAQLNVESDVDAYAPGSPFSFDRSRNDQDTSIGGELAVGYLKWTPLSRQIFAEFKIEPCLNYS